MILNPVVCGFLKNIPVRSAGPGSPANFARQQADYLPLEHEPWPTLTQKLDAGLPVSLRQPGSFVAGVQKA